MVRLDTANSPAHLTVRDCAHMHANMQCILCRRTPLVTKEKIYELLKKMPNWNLRPDEKAISRQFSTKDFVAALKFLNQAGEIAEEEGHHPDLHIRNYR